MNELRCTCPVCKTADPYQPPPPSSPQKAREPPQSPWPLTPTQRRAVDALRVRALERILDLVHSLCASFPDTARATAASSAVAGAPAPLLGPPLFRCAP